MEQLTNEIRVSHADRALNEVLEGIGDSMVPFSRHFTQSEEFFLKLEGEFTVPHLPIHHDVRLSVPSHTYLASLREVLSQLVALVPRILRELTWFFDPAEILRPCFFKIYRVEDSLYLYLLRLDLVQKPMEGEVLERGTNDLTPCYRTRKLFLEPVVIPLTEVAREDGRIRAFRVLQTVSQTWIGEFGRGYFQQGIWMDLDLTKFFSKLFLPAGARSYPYYPFLCRYRTICEALLDLSPEGRLAVVPRLHQALAFLQPVMGGIEQVMRHASFSEDLPLFRELKSRVPPAWYEPWRGLRVEAYLNEREGKEYRIDG